MLYAYYHIYFNKIDPDNPLQKEYFTAYQLYGSSNVWDLVNGEGIFDWLPVPIPYFLALLAANIWLKLLLRFQITKVFGPLFKVIIKMFQELVLFMAFWLVVLLAFTSVYNLIFANVAELENNFLVIFYKLFEYSQGAFDVSIYCQETDSITCYVGRGFMIFFLLFNSILILNFVIAILSSTYAFYEDKKLGLYYEVLVGQFPIL